MLIRRANISLALQASKDFQVDSTVARYWARKTSEPDFHPGSWGGSSEEEDVAIRRHLCQVLIWVYLQKDNQPSLQELSVYLGTFGITYCKSSISAMLKQWRWSFKIPSVVQSSKYTPLNVQYYKQFCTWFANTDIH